MKKLAKSEKERADWGRSKCHGPVNSTERCWINFKRNKFKAGGSAAVSHLLSMEILPGTVRLADDKVALSLSLLVLPFPCRSAFAAANLTGPHSTRGVEISPHPRAEHTRCLTYCLPEKSNSKRGAGIENAEFDRSTRNSLWSGRCEDR